MTKAQKIRDYLAKFPDKSPKEAARELGVTPGYVSNIKNQTKKQPVVSSPTKHLVQAATLIRETGGMSQAQQVLEDAEELVTLLN